MTAHGVSSAEMELGQQLVFFNELFGWARIAFVALADRPPPHALYGPSLEGTSVIQVSAACLNWHKPNILSSSFLPAYGIKL